MTAADLLASDFGTLPDLLRRHAAERPDGLPCSAIGKILKRELRDPLETAA